MRALCVLLLLCGACATTTSATGPESPSVARPVSCAALVAGSVALSILTLGLAPTDIIAIAACERLLDR